MAELVITGGAVVTVDDGFVVHDPGWVHVVDGHIAGVGPGDAPDNELLAYAAGHEQVILTQDLDFGTLLAREGLTTSVIQFRTQAVLPDDLGPTLLAAIDAAQPYLDSGALVTIDPTKHRLTLLPIRPE